MLLEVEGLLKCARLTVAAGTESVEEGEALMPIFCMEGRGGRLGELFLVRTDPSALCLGCG